MSEKDLKELKPFDVVIYTITNEQALVKSVNEKGAFLLFRIQSTAQFCDARLIERI